MGLAPYFDKDLKGEWFLVYVVDMLVWFAIGYITAGGTL